MNVLLRFTITVAVTLCMVSKSDCGMIDDLFGKVKNTTKEIKEDVKDWYYFGKDLMFGGDDNSTETSTEGLEKQEGFVRGMYHGLKEKVVALKTKIHDKVFGPNTNDTRKGFVRNMYNKVKNKISRAKHYIFDKNKHVSNNVTVILQQNFHNNVEGAKEEMNTLMSFFNDTSNDFKVDVRDAFLDSKTFIEEMNKNISETFNKEKENFNVAVNKINNEAKEHTNNAKGNINGFNSDVQQKLNEGKEKTDENYHKLLEHGGSVANEVRNIADDLVKEGDEKVTTITKSGDKYLQEVDNKEKELISNMEKKTQEWADNSIDQMKKLSN